MCKHTLYIIRGVPGSGKTTLANALVSPANVVEADQYFTWGGKYNFDPSQLRHAHDWCFRRVGMKMSANEGNIAVANTFTRHWEYERYVTAAEQFGYNVKVLICTDRYPNVHGVPEEKVEQMRNRFEY